MIYLPQSKVSDSDEAALAPGASIAADGQALVRVPGATFEGVQVSTGSAGEIFAGFSYCSTVGAAFLESYATKYEEFVNATAGGPIVLQRAPVAGQFTVRNKTTGAPITGLTLADKSISGAGLTAGLAVTVVYKYPQSVVEAKSRAGDPQPGGYAGDVVGQVGRAKRGVIFIDQFDAAVDWASDDPITLGPNGQLTKGGTGTEINAVVVSLPSAEIPCLGIEFDL